MIERILPDNGYRSHVWARTCARLGIAHTRTRPYRPATNAKAERVNRTLLDEWAYVRFYGSETERAGTLEEFLARLQPPQVPYRGWRGPPVRRVNNVSGDHT